MIEVKNLSLKLGDFSMKDINLTIENGEFFVLLGPTGNGKTVLLESIAGLQQLESGRIFINEQEVTGKKPEERNISICYQDQALFPHMRVKDNIRYGLRFRKDGQDPKYQEKFELLVDLLKIAHILNRYPVFLSGGEKQRVALARALIVDPDILLLDEPLSALDAEIKASIETELKSLHEKLKITTIMVTHDFREAYYLAHRVGIIKAGKIMQVGTIDEVFEKPASLFVAEFAGMKNLIKIDELKEKQQFQTFLDHLHIAEGAVYTGIRPENIIISDDKFAGDCFFTGIISHTRNNGIFREIDIESQGIVFKAYLTSNRYNELRLHTGEEVYFGFDLNRVCVL